MNKVIVLLSLMLLISGLYCRTSDLKLVRETEFKDIKSKEFSGFSTYELALAHQLREHIQKESRVDKQLGLFKDYLILNQVFEDKIIDSTEWNVIRGVAIVALGRGQLHYYDTRREAIITIRVENSRYIPHIVEGRVNLGLHSYPSDIYRRGEYVYAVKTNTRTPLSDREFITKLEQRRKEIFSPTIPFSSVFDKLLNDDPNLLRVLLKNDEVCKAIQEKTGFTLKGFAAGLLRIRDLPDPPVDTTIVKDQLPHKDVEKPLIILPTPQLQDDDILVTEAADGRFLKRLEFVYDVSKDDLDPVTSKGKDARSIKQSNIQPDNFSVRAVYGGVDGEEFRSEPSAYFTLVKRPEPLPVDHKDDSKIPMQTPNWMLNYYLPVASLASVGGLWRSAERSSEYFSRYSKPSISSANAIKNKERTQEANDFLWWSGLRSGFTIYHYASSKTAKIPSISEDWVTGSLIFSSAVTLGSGVWAFLAGDDQCYNNDLYFSPGGLNEKMLWDFSVSNSLYGYRRIHHHHSNGNKKAVFGESALYAGYLGMVIWSNVTGSRSEEQKLKILCNLSILGFMYMYK